MPDSKPEVGPHHEKLDAWCEEVDRLLGRESEMERQKRLAHQRDKQKRRTKARARAA